MNDNDISIEISNVLILRVPMHQKGTLELWISYLTSGNFHNYTFKYIRLFYKMGNE
jgi:hypothetical protein